MRVNDTEPPEQRARRQIDAMLLASGWDVQDRAAMNLAAAPGVAIREFQTLDEFVAPYKKAAWHERAATWGDGTPDEGWRTCEYDELVNRDKCSLDLFWLKDDSLFDAENLPEPDVIAQEVADDLTAALVQIEEILGDLEASAR